MPNFSSDWANKAIDISSALDLYIVRCAKWFLQCILFWNVIKINEQEKTAILVMLKTRPRKTENSRLSKNGYFFFSNIPLALRPP